VTLIAKGSNVLISRDAAAAGIGCAEESNVTIQAVEFGSLSVTGGDSAAGIGANANQSGPVRR
jgi:hypothetical protein